MLEFVYQRERNIYILVEYPEINKKISSKTIFYKKPNFVLCSVSTGDLSNIFVYLLMLFSDIFQPEQQRAAAARALNFRMKRELARKRVQSQMALSLALGHFPRVSAFSSADCEVANGHFFGSLFLSPLFS